MSPPQLAPSGTSQGVTAATLKAGADLNEVGRTGSTPLIYSAIKLDKRLVTALLSSGADVNRRQEDGHTALSAACELVSVDPTMLEMLINIGNVDLNSPMLGKDPLLYYLIGSSRLDLIATALKKGANSSALSGSERPLVAEAAIIERYDEAQLLLDAGASPDSMDRAGTSLMSWVNDGSSPCEPVAFAAGRASRHVAGGAARLCAVPVMTQDLIAPSGNLIPIQGPAGHVQGPEMGRAAAPGSSFYPGWVIGIESSCSPVLFLLRAPVLVCLLQFSVVGFQVYAKRYLTALNGSFSTQGQAHE